MVCSIAMSILPSCFKITVLTHNNHFVNLVSKTTNFLLYLISLYLLIGLTSKMFAKGPGDRGSVPGRVIAKTQKWSLIPPCLTLSIIR